MNDETILAIFVIILIITSFAHGYLTGHSTGMIDERRDGENGKILSKTDKDGEA